MLSACAVSAPPCQADNGNLALLAAASGARVGVGNVAASPAIGRPRIDLHAIDMKSPEGDYAACLGTALATDLSAAGLLDPASASQLSATLLRNEISSEAGRRAAGAAVRRSGSRAGLARLKRPGAGASAAPAAVRSLPLPP